MTGISVEELRDSLIRREQGAPNAPPLWTIPPERAAETARAADTVEECMAVLEKGGGNIVGDLLRGQGEFKHWTHYPQGDVHDRETHAQYYYHAHPTAQRSGEHGHFHTFLRAAGMPETIRPAALPDAAKRPLGKDALCHLAAISMDRRGRPLRLFTVNRWVTGESWYAAEDAIALLDRFHIGHAVPSLPANRWVGAMLRLFRPQIEWLLRERDAAVRTWAAGNPGADAPVWEDRRLETTSALDISIAAQARLARAAAARPGRRSAGAGGGRAPAGAAPANRAFRRRHLLGIAGMNAAEIDCLLDRAQVHAARGAAADRSDRKSVV